VEFSATDKRAYFYQTDGTVHEKYGYDGTSWAREQLYSYVGGEHLATLGTTGGWKYTFRDHRGDLRLLSGSAGAVLSRHDFYPYGMERTTPSTEEFRVFTQQERDDESMLDHFWFRKYQSNWARWTSPDPLLGDISNPQSLNRYGYVIGNPINLIDPLGLHDCKDFGPGWTDDWLADGSHTCRSISNVAPRTDPDHKRVVPIRDYLFWLNYWENRGLDGLCFVLCGSSDFFAGAGDTLSFGISAGIREGFTPASDIVDYSSPGYWAGVGTGAGVGLGAGALFGASAAYGLETRIAIHGAHHTFRYGLGRLTHIQVNWWIRGASGGGGVWRFLLPWR